MRRLWLLALAPVLLVALLTLSPTITRAAVFQADPETLTPTVDVTVDAPNTETPTNTATLAAIVSPSATIDPCAEGCETVASTNTAIPEATFDPCANAQGTGGQSAPAGVIDCPTETAIPGATNTATDVVSSPTSVPTARPTYDTEISDAVTQLPESGTTAPDVVAAVTVLPSGMTGATITGLPNAGSGTPGSASPAWLLVVAALVALSVCARTISQRCKAG